MRLEERITGFEPDCRPDRQSGHQGGRSPEDDSAFPFFPDCRAGEEASAFHCFFHPITSITQKHCATELADPQWPIEYRRYYRRMPVGLTSDIAAIVAKLENFSMGSDSRFFLCCFSSPATLSFLSQHALRGLVEVDAMNRFEFA